MTMSVDIGKFKAIVEYNGIIAKRSHEVELNVIWSSCGCYSVSYYRPRDAESHEIIVSENWYPANINVSFTPEQFEKVAELYNDAPRQDRENCYKPFYENYDLDRGMMDFGCDTLFQAFKDPKVKDPKEERVYLVNHQFRSGNPTTTTDVLGLKIEDFYKLKELIDSNKDEIFYSGCKISWRNSPNEDHEE